jgi:hypothetical protein
MNKSELLRWLQLEQQQWEAFLHQSVAHPALGQNVT